MMLSKCDGYYIMRLKLWSQIQLEAWLLPFLGDLLLLEPNFISHFNSVLSHKLQTNQAHEADHLASYCRTITERCLVLARELCYKEEWLKQSTSKAWLAWAQVGISLLITSVDNLPLVSYIYMNWVSHCLSHTCTSTCIYSVISSFPKLPT